jgi:hypothetical protein
MMKGRIAHKMLFFLLVAIVQEELMHGYSGLGKSRISN